MLDGGGFGGENMLFFFLHYPSSHPAFSCAGDGGALLEPPPAVLGRQTDARPFTFSHISAKNLPNLPHGQVGIRLWTEAGEAKVKPR